MPVNFTKLPSFERLNELLVYDPESGELRWKINKSNVKAGSIAGYIHTRKDGRKEWEIKIDYKKYMSARIIWILYHHEDPGSLTIDHINRDPLDNHIANLRLADIHEQNLNTRCTSPTTATRYIGLTMHSRENEHKRPRWQGQIRISGHCYSFGSTAVNSINDPPPDWLIDRAARIYGIRDNPYITDEDLIKMIRIRCSRSLTV